MSQLGIGWVDGAVLHERVAARAAARARRAWGRGSWREVRDLALLLKVTTAGPLAMVVLRVRGGSPPAVVLTAMSVVAAVGLAHVFRRDYAMELNLTPVFLAGFPEDRWRRAATRWIPGRHRAAAPRPASCARAPTSQSGSRRAGR
jgi:hypothetical protein